MLLEHKARILIIKNALELGLSVDNEKLEIKVNGEIINFGNLIETMPVSFREGLEELKENPHCRQIPYLFQTFIEMFGGFYFRGSDDTQALSSITGIPENQIISSLGLMDSFFPFYKGWFYMQKGSLNCMKMVPGFVRGSGCFTRQSLFELTEYKDKYSEISWLIGKWHN